jgi:hypothetical protein
LYPYVTSGCQARVNDFDWDTSGSTTYGSLSLTSRTGNYTHTNANMSTNNVWQNVQLAPWTSDSDSSDYGVWSSNVSIHWYPGNNNYGVIYLANYASSGGAPTASPQANSFRLYFPSDVGAAPIKPYLTQTFSTVSGPNPTQPGRTTQLRVTVQMVNPTGSMGTITFSSSNTVRAYVPSGEVVYADNATASQGSVTSQPAIGASGEIVWNPGTINSGTTATLTYDLNVTPNSAPKTITITGTPDSNGTRATYLDETGRANQTRATFTFGPLCGLRVSSEEPTAVEMASFAAASTPWTVELDWETALESNALGFNIYRSASLDGERVLLNPELIPSQSLGGVGAAYQFVDTDIQIGNTYYYWLEFVDVSEKSNYGPVQATGMAGIYLPIIQKP